MDKMRYMRREHMDEIKHVVTGDVLIIGSGLAGSIAAISCL